MDLVTLFENKTSLLLLESINKIICIHIGFFWDFLYVSNPNGRQNRGVNWTGCLPFEIWSMEVSFTEEIQKFDFLVSFLRQRHELHTSPRNLTCLSPKKLKQFRPEIFISQFVWTVASVSSDSIYIAQFFTSKYVNCRANIVSSETECLIVS